MRRLALIVIFFSLLITYAGLGYVGEISLPKRAPAVLRPYSKVHFGPIKEPSGLVKSRIWPDVFWVHNDSGDKPRIFAMRRDGSIIKPEGVQNYAGINIANALHIDWEDIAADDAGNLIIGDFGNNNNTRRDLAIYVLKEPNPLDTVTAVASKKIMFYYPDQKSIPPKNPNFDAEALFWARGKIYLFTKHRTDTLTKLYRFDSLDSAKVNPLTLIDSFDIGGQVTAADASFSGSQVAVLTYNAVWIFEAKEGSDHYFDGKISWLPISARQCEGICFDNHKLVVSNEQEDLFEIKIDDLMVVKDN